MVNYRAARTLILPPAARTLVLQSCIREHLHRIKLYAAVIMPDHVHLLLGPLRDEETRFYHLAVILQAIKGASAHAVNKLLKRQGPVWQEEYFDHVVRSDESLLAKIEYIRQNPVRKGLVHVPEEYEWLWINNEALV
jgi:REP element-mobilizing transposase RayT